MPESHMDARRKDILATAEKLFREKGYAKTTINDILKKQNIAKGTFYYYFKSKDEVVDAIVLADSSDKAEKVRAIAADRSLDTHSKLLRAAHVLYSGRPNDSVSADAEMHKRILLSDVKLVAPEVAVILAAGVKAGDLTCEFPIEAAEYLLSACKTILNAAYCGCQPSQLEMRVWAFLWSAEQLLGCESGSLDYLIPFLMK